LLLKRRVNKALWNNNVIQNATKDKEKEIDINREWDNISRSIKQAAEEEIPRKKITNSSINKAPKKRYTELQSAINTIRKIVKSCKKKKGLYRTEEEQLEIEKELEKINRSTKTNIEIEGCLWSEQLQEELTRWWKIIKEKLVAENSNALRLEINEHIDRRCEMIKNNQSRMINSLLEKPFKKVAIDRLLINKVEGNELLNNPEEVLNATAEHFRSQFKKRSFQKEGITYEWEKVYSPIAEIKESYYKNLNKRITDKE